MNSTRVSTLFAKCVLLVSPFIILFATYVYYDPAQVIWHYTDFNNLYMQNRGFISTQTFINNNSAQKYHSFILGNSRSGPYYTTDWAPYIHDKNPYHFDAAGESMTGLYGKIKFLDTHADSLKNVLIVLDRTLLRMIGGRPDGGPLFMTDNRVSENSWLDFQMSFIKIYFSEDYAFKFLKYKLFGGELPAGTDKYHYQPISNDMPMWKHDREIAEDSAGYYTRNSKEFKLPPRNSADIANEPAIKQEQLAMLKEMAAIFRRHHTNYAIVISPMLDKIPMNQQDLRVLREIFGPTHVFDYSGTNKFTQNYRDYYEWSHYRPHVARQIMREIYNSPN